MLMFIVWYATAVINYASSGVIYDHNNVYSLIFGADARCSTRVSSEQGTPTEGEGSVRLASSLT